jgi:hypothetical protein
MEPVAMISAAVAIGASEGARETTKQVISDAYSALRNWITSKYGSLTAEVDGLEQDPQEDLRRALLAKKLARAGADNDPQLRDLAQTLLSIVADQKPDLPATVGVALRRVSVRGDIDVVDIAFEGGNGVIAEDVGVADSLLVRGVNARGPQEPTPPSPSAGTVTGKPVLPTQSFTSAQRNVNAGRDIVTNVNYGAREAGNSGGRVRAVTASIEAVPVGRSLWAVMVKNGTAGPIGDLEVDVYAVDDSGRRSLIRCLPAKGNVSLRELMSDAMTQALSGGLDAFGQQAQSMYPGLPAGMGFGAQMSQLAQLGSYGPMMSSHLMNSPRMAQVLQQAQQQMVDRFPVVIAAGQSAGVLYVVEGESEVRADIQFADEAGCFWRRPFGKTPEPLLDDEEQG